MQEDIFSLPWRERVRVRGEKLGTLTSFPLPSRERMLDELLSTTILLALL
jgi:hypothetical protein